MANPIGKVLQGRYKVQSFLGDGGHGQVYRAIDQQLQRPVAIKRLRYPAGVAPHIQARFQQEALVLAALEHPHIIEVLDVFEEEGWLYHVMVFCAAGSLADFAKQSGRLTVDETIEIGKSIANALIAAHAQGIVHRDVKASNILLSPASEGFVIKLADFGIAHVPREGDQLTRVGDVLGTPPNWAPEQLNGQALSKTDIYALAVTLYRLLTGRHYLDLDDIDEMEKRRRIMQVKPRAIRGYRSDVPVWLEQLLQQALEKDPADRPDAVAFYELMCSEGASSRPAKETSKFLRVPTVGVQDPGSRSVAIQFIMGAVVSALVALVLVLAYLNFSADEAVMPDWADVPDIAGQLNQLDSAPERVPPPQPTPTPAFDSSETLVEPELAPPAEVTTTEAISERATIEVRPTLVVVTGTYPAEGVRLRYGPDLESAVLDVLPDGYELTLMEVLLSGDWARVDTNSELGQGWVSTGYLYDPALGRYLSTLSGN